MTTSGSSQGEQPISEQDVTGFTQKLEQWSATLPPAEQALLSMILSRAHSTTEDTDVQGFTLLTSAVTRSWLSPWALNQSLSYRGILGADDAFVKDTGPTWVNSPRASIGGFGGEVIR
jgi:hypothetical protein